MKSTLLSLLLLLSFVANAQFKKGDQFLGGTFSFNAQNSSDSPNGVSTNQINSFDVNPTMGFFINEKWALGGQVGYGMSHSETTNNTSYKYEYNTQSVSAQLFAQRYFPISEKFFFLLRGYLGFSRGNDKSTSSDLIGGSTNEDNTPYYRLSTAISSSFVFFPSPKWGIQASLGSISYSFMRDLSSDNKKNNLNLYYSPFSFGLVYYFKRS